jgi:hypothetical protein
MPTPWSVVVVEAVGHVVGINDGPCRYRGIRTTQNVFLYLRCVCAASARFRRCTGEKDKPVLWNKAS